MAIIITITSYIMIKINKADNSDKDRFKIKIMNI